MGKKIVYLKSSHLKYRYRLEIMTNILLIIIAFLASTVGAVCGIGGGVIIQPVLNSLQIINVEAVSFLSSGTVLSMAAYSVARNRLSGTIEQNTDARISLFLAVGAAVGGILGRQVFAVVLGYVDNSELLGGIQAVLLFCLMFGTLLYTLNRNKIRTHRVKGMAASFSIALILGAVSAFLGIGGGPMNLIVLYYFFSMQTKVAVKNSLYIILFSQATNIAFTIISGATPKLEVFSLVVMVLGGILGGVVGRYLNARMSEKKVEKCFLFLTVVLVLINGYNIVTLL